MIIESAAIYSTFSLLFLIPFTLNHTTSLALSQLFLQALSPVQVRVLAPCGTPRLNIFRGLFHSFNRVSSGPRQVMVT
jgi:hypothetical protein